VVAADVMTALHPAGIPNSSLSQPSVTCSMREASGELTQL
jgi:hypothetical protein